MSGTRWPRRRTAHVGAPDRPPGGHVEDLQTTRPARRYDRGRATGPAAAPAPRRPATVARPAGRDEPSRARRSAGRLRTPGAADPRPRDRPRGRPGHARRTPCGDLPLGTAGRRPAAPPLPAREPRIALP